MQVKQGCLNFTTVVDLPEGAPVLTGTFSIRGCLVTNYLILVPLIALLI
jgi:hypothetical protein